MARATEHGRAVTAQMTRRHGTLEDAIDAGNVALSAAGVTKAVRRQARAACETCHRFHPSGYPARQEPTDPSTALAGGI